MASFINPVSNEINAIRTRLTKLELAFEYEGEGFKADQMEVSGLLTSISVGTEILERKCCDELASYTGSKIDHL